MSQKTSNDYAPLVMVSIWGRKRTLPHKTVYQNGSIDTSFNPPLLLLDSTYNKEEKLRKIARYKITNNF
jgi:hypothetical protein